MTSRSQIVLPHPMLACSLAIACSMPIFCLAETLNLAQAIGLALKQNPDVLVQYASISAAQGQLEQAKGQFDTVVSANLAQKREITPLNARNDPAGVRQSINQAVTYQVGASKLLQNGNRLEGSVSAESSRDSLLYGGTAQNTLKLTVALNIPLLKGSGNDVAGLDVELAQLRMQASRYDLRYQTSLILQASVAAYWDLLAKVKLEKLAQATAERSRQLLASTQKLVDAQERPRGDLVLLQADLVDKTAAQRQAAQQSSQARRYLGRLLGLDGQLATQISLSEQDFPAEVGDADKLLQMTRQLSALALQQRADLHSLQLQLEQAQLQSKIAQKNLKPQLDLNLALAYGNASEGGSRYGFFAQGGQSQSEPSVYAQLSYQFPVENRTAQGQFKQSAAQLTQLQIKYRDAEVALHNGVQNVVQLLASNAAQVEAAKQSLALYELAVKQEIIKQKNGISTLLDVLSIEGRYNLAQANLIQLQAELAKSLIEIQHETGVILPPPRSESDDTDHFTLDTAKFTSLKPLFNLVSGRQ